MLVDPVLLRGFRRSLGGCVSQACGTVGGRLLTQDQGIHPGVKGQAFLFADECFIQGI